MRERLRKIGIWLWHRDPAKLVGAGLVATFLWHPSWEVLGSMLLVVVMAYFQNWSYSLSSRSAMRNSVAYHLLASFLSSLTFFMTFRYIVLNNMPWHLFPAYLFGTVLGSVHGQAISMLIERWLKLSAKASVLEEKLGIKQVDKNPWEGQEERLFRFWPAVIFLLFAFMVQVAWMQRLNLEVVALVALIGASAYLFLRQLHGLLYQHAQEHWRWLLFAGVVLSTVFVGRLALAHAYESTLFVIVMILGFPDEFLHGTHRVARSSDNYWFHLFTILAKVSVKLTQVAILFQLDMTWALVLPMATGSMLGTLSGSTYAKRFAELINASYDAHVIKGKPITWPIWQWMFLAACIGVHFWFFGLYQWQALVALAGYSFLQYASFTLSSRARQRKNMQYVAWSSVLSNSAFYLAMKTLAQADTGAGEKQEVAWQETIPYVAGNAGGSLGGHTVAMRVEQVLGAVMDEDEHEPPKPKAEVVPFPSKEKAS